MTKKHVTIYDVAREAGVSPATVSRILTGTARVRSVKRERVLEVIRQMNFQPNAFARALSENRNRMIGIMVAHTGNSYYNSLFAACQSEAYRRGYVSMVMNTYSRPQYEESVMMRMQEMRPEAVIIAGGRVDLEVPDPAFMDLLRATRESVRLVVGSRSPMPGIPGVAVDHRASVDLAVRYLEKLGHREIGFIYTGTPYYGTQQRLQRFRQRKPVNSRKCKGCGERNSQLGLFRRFCLRRRRNQTGACYPAGNSFLRQISDRIYGQLFI